MDPTLTPAPDPNNDLKPQIEASRVSGVAPLAVFFDATGTAGLADQDYVSAQFQWDFGDLSAGTWSPTGRSCNQATGFLAAHVFEQPGTYQVQLTVQDKTGHTGQAAVTIQVQAFSGTSYYLSALTGNDANDGLSPEPQGVGHGPWRSLGKLGSADGDAHPAVLSGSNLRVQLKRGEVFDLGPGQTLTLAHINPSGSGPPVVLGAYGQGARPVIRTTDPNVEAIYLEDCHDLVLMDLEVAGAYQWEGVVPDALHMGLVSGPGCEKLLGLRLAVHGFYYGILWDGLPVAEQYLVDSEVHHNYLIQYGSNGGRRLALLGNRIEDSYLSHNVYSYFQDKYCITDNRFARPGWNDQGENDKRKDGHFYSNRCNLRLAIHDQGAKDVVIVSNVCSEGSAKIQVGLMDSSSTGVGYENVLVEKNLLVNQENAFWLTSGVALDAVHRAMVRNNVINHGPMGSNDVAISMDYSSAGNGQCKSSQNVDIFNNSYYSQYQGTVNNSNIFLVLRRSDSANFSVLNNIASISSTPESNFENYIYEIPKGFAMANLISDSNIFYIPLSSIFALIGEQRLDFAKWKSDFSKDSNSSDADPLYIDPAKENLNIQNTAKGYAKDSPAIDSGVPVPVFDAYDGTPRPQGSRWDIGATEIPK